MFMYICGLHLIIIYQSTI